LSACTTSMSRPSTVSWITTSDYNFDETRFMMGIICTGKVVTTSDGRSKAKLAQPGNLEWTAVIQGVNALGWNIPPLIILAAQYHLANWYTSATSLPTDVSQLPIMADYQYSWPRLDQALRLSYGAPDKGQIPVVDPRRPRKPPLNRVRAILPAEQYHHALHTSELFP
jgi:hypothetical protein